MILTKFLTCRLSAESTGDFPQKSLSRHFLAAILNFCVKRKHTFILEMVQDRAILIKFLTCRVSAEYTGNISQKSLCRHFDGHLEFLCKVQKRICLRERDFDCHLEFWRKLKMSFISKTLRDKVILSNVWTFWVLETLDIVPVKKVEFPELCQPC